MFVSILTPTKNSEDLISTHYREVTAALEKRVSEYEILYVDDGSEDNSVAAITGLIRTDNHVRGMFLDSSYGQHTALLVGLLDNPSDVIVTLDVDLEVPASAISDLLDAIETGADYVSGVRRSTKRKTVARFLGSHLFHTYLRHRTKLPIDDFGCAATAMTREIKIRALTCRRPYIGLKHLFAASAGSLANVPVAELQIDGARSSYGFHEIKRALRTEHGTKTGVDLPAGIVIRNDGRCRAVKPLDPFDVKFLDYPYSVYDDYRKRDPVHWGKAHTPNHPGTWYLTRYADIVDVLKDGRFSRKYVGDNNANVTMNSSTEFTRDWVVMKDPPEHARIRDAFRKALSGRGKSAIQSTVVRICHEHLGNVRNTVADTGGFDFMADFAYPYPVAVISDLMGLPSEMNSQLVQWSGALLSAIDFKKDPDTYRRAAVAATAFGDYLREIFETRRRCPRDDMMSVLARLQCEEKSLSPDELVANCIFLFVAGHETTVNLLGNGLFALLSHPKQWERLLRNRDLVHSAVEELLRYDCAVQATSRIASENVIIGDKLIRRGQQVCLLLGAANRDPEQYVSPGTLDVGRKPGSHVSFGFGKHVCLGASLARLEAAVAIEALLDMLSSTRITVVSTSRRASIVFRGFDSIELSVRSDG